eukprot:991744-Pelagomonas_calceolata.AAC.2
MGTKLRLNSKLDQDLEVCLDSNQTSIRHRAPQNQCAGMKNANKRRAPCSLVLLLLCFDNHIPFLPCLLTELKWILPALLNAFCCCFKDVTYFQEKIKSGEAYNVTCCGPFFTKPSPDYNIQNVEEQIGKNDELIILVSAPGDFHPWHGREEDGPGNVSPAAKATCSLGSYWKPNIKRREPSQSLNVEHFFCTFVRRKARRQSTVTSLSSQSGCSLTLTPLLCMQLYTIQDPMDPDLRDYYVALADRDYEDLDLWKAYWYEGIGE